MKKCKELYITNERSNKTYYVARLAEDQNTIVIQRVYRAPDDVRTYHTLTSRNTPKNIHRVRKIHIKYDFVGFIPINELMNKKGDSE